jgi:hypothetical protein
MIKVLLTDNEDLNIYTKVPILPNKGDYIWVENNEYQILSIIFEFDKKGFKYIEICCTLTYSPS